jgi:Cu(I)/Ag(I) efflux system periplasmic protein CusF
MKAVAIAVVFAAATSIAYAGEMKGMEMSMGDRKGMDMSKSEKKGTHKATATVKSIDAKGGTVMLDHEPVKSMNWPAMTMAFKVQDKALMDKLTQGKKVEVEFEQRGKDYVITSAK